VMYRLSSAKRYFLALLLLAGFLSGCVTTSDSRFSREADRDDAVDSFVQLGTAYIAQGNTERARTHLERALELDPQSAPALSAMGLVYRSEGETGHAEDAFRKALSNDASYTRGRAYYGAFLYGEGRYQEAREQFRRASENTSYDERSSVFFNLGMAEERLGNLQAAADAYRRSLELGRGDVRSLLALSRTLTDLGEYDRAGAYYGQLTDMMARNPRMVHSPESLLTGIRIARHFGDRDRESSLALQLKNNYPDSVEYQQYRALISNGQ